MAKQNSVQHQTLTEDKYIKLYQQSIDDASTFWAEQAECFITWYKPWQTVTESDFTQGYVRWFTGAQVNASYNCLDRHLPHKASDIAIYWEGDNGHRRQALSYQMLYARVCRFANTLKSLGVKKGDNVCIYMPMIPDAIIAMLACSRIGAVHSVVFAGFSAHALAERIQNANCKVVITADQSIRGGKSFPLKINVDEALERLKVRHVLVVKNSGNCVPMQPKRDVWYHEASRFESDVCAPVVMDAEDPLFILYTSGSTGKPKGLVHTTAGYLVYAAVTFRYVFDYAPKDIYWCTADIGWITGHTYAVYSPLLNGATSVIYEGVITTPADIAWKIIDRYKVNIFYTAPTAIRALMAFGDAPLASTKRTSLKLLGTVGEPINQEAWQWYREKVGLKQCWIVDTWWQTETGGIMIAPLKNIGQPKPGAACLPLFGIKPQIVDAQGKAVKQGEKGFLTITQSWPGLARTIYANHERYVKGYFGPYAGSYFTGDGAYQDVDGSYWITGRVDDVINVAGHRLGTAEIENVLAKHEDVAEAAVIGVPHPVKGESVYAFVSLAEGKQWSDSLIPILQNDVIEAIGKLAMPEKIEYVPKLPKTRSGKIMRRLLRNVVTGDIDKIGDTSTLAEPEVLEQLKAAHQKK